MILVIEAPYRSKKGDSLLVLLVENEIQVKKSRVEIISFDRDSLIEIEAGEGKET